MFGVFRKSIVVSILHFDTSLFRKMFKLLTCKEIMTFESRASCGECNMAKSPFSFKILSLLFGEKKNLSPNFGLMVFFFGLGRFSIY